MQALFYSENQRQNGSLCNVLLSKVCRHTLLMASAVALHVLKACLRLIVMGSFMSSVKYRCGALRKVHLE